MTDSQGLPLSYELFSGSTGETKTFIPVLNQMKKTHHFSKFFVTADRGMFSKQNISHLEKEGFPYVMACPLRKKSKAFKEKILDLSHYRNINEDMKAFDFFDDEKRRFCIGFSKKRAIKDKKDRQTLLDKIEALKDDRGLISVKSVSKNKGIGRYLETQKGFVSVKTKTIKEEEKWDGLFGVCTNIKSKKPEEILSSYKKLWKIEESFRINKHTLKMRPIFHQLSRRIKTHILICFLSYTLLRYLEIFLKSKNLHFGHQELIDILMGVEKWLLTDSRTKQKYIVPKQISTEAQHIYKALRLNRRETPYRVLN